jgi:enoyl-CoA hydratase
VPREQLVETAMQIASKIAEKSPYLLKLTKESLTGIAADRELEDNYRWEQGFTLQAYLSPDSVEARKAFAEKRDAKF